MTSFGWFLAKVGMFATFVGLIYFAISAVLNLIKDKIGDFSTIGNNALYILERLHICEALNIYISAVIATWIINKIINYWGN